MGSSTLTTLTISHQPRLQEALSVCTRREGAESAIRDPASGVLEECKGLVTYVVHNGSYESSYGSGDRRR